MSSKPVIASFCATFLAAEMRHVYRQIVGLKTFEPLILTQKRRNAGDFPFPENRIVTLPKPLTRELRRAWAKRIKKAPWQLYGSEVTSIESVLREHNVSLLHIWFGHIGMHLVPLLRSTTRPCPAVVSFHGADASVGLDKPGHLAAVQAVFEYADGVLVRSQSLAQELRELGCPTEKIHLQRTGLPLDEWSLAESRSAPEDGAWHLVQTCRLIEKKGLDLTLKALAQARRTFPKMHLTIAGDGGLRPKLEKQAQQLGITEAVRFAGFLNQEEMRELYASAHIFLHPSRVGSDGNREGVPNAMLEAMATGLPVIATQHGGIPDAVENGVDGLLSEENDDASISKSILKIAGNPDLWQSMGSAARSSICKKFDQSAGIAALESIYQELITSH